MLACKSLGLIGLSRFLQVSLRFQIIGILPCSSAELRFVSQLRSTASHRKTLYICASVLFSFARGIPLRRDAFSYLKNNHFLATFHTLIPIAPLLLKTPLTTKKRASPAETVSIRRAHSSRFLLLPPSLHSLTARACVVPKPTFHYAIASFQASFVPPRSRLFYLFRLKHSPCQCDIFIGRNNFINENTAKILWLQM